MCAKPHHLLALAYVLALGQPLLPLLIHWISPPPVIRKPASGLELVGSLFDMAGAAGYGYRTLLITAACALLAMLATVAAWWLWRRAPDSAADAPAALWTWAPLPLALLGLLVAALVNDTLVVKMQ